MRDLTEIEELNEEFLNKKGVHFATVCLTANILDKGIFDAHRGIVKFLKDGELHDFSMQENGSSEKVYLDTTILTFKESVSTKTSVYKAGTRGDKRMWFGATIYDYTEDDNIFALFARNGHLFIINESKIDLEHCFYTSVENPVKSFLKSIIKKE